MFKKYNKSLTVGLLIITGVCVATFLFLLFSYIFNLGISSSFEECLSSLVGGAIGGFATIFTVLILTMKNNKDDSKKELVNYCNNLTILLGKCGQCIRSLQEYNNLIAKKEKMLEKKSFEEQKYHDLLQKHHDLLQKHHGLLHKHYDKNKAKKEINIDKELEITKENIEHINKNLEIIDRKIYIQRSKYLKDDDKKLVYLMQIRIQLNLFISTYFYDYDKEITNKAEDLYREINKYLDVSKRKKLNFEKLDKIQDKCNVFIDLLIDSL